MRFFFSFLGFLFSLTYRGEFFSLSHWEEDLFHLVIPPSSDGWMGACDVHYGILGLWFSWQWWGCSSSSLDTRGWPFSFRIDPVNYSSRYRVPASSVAGEGTILLGNRCRGTALKSSGIPFSEDGCIWAGPPA